MKNLSLLISLLLLLSFAAIAQPPTASQQPKAADPKDVGSLDAIMKAIYDVISGEKGKPRDWDRFRSMFHPDGRLIPSGKNAETGVTSAKASTPDEYATRASAAFASSGFFENEIARHVDMYGNIAQVFSTYESRRAPGEKPFARGINSFQLLNDGKRWWVITIYWQAETPENPIPAEYLKNKK